MYTQRSYIRARPGGYTRTSPKGGYVYRIAYVKVIRATYNKDRTMRAWLIKSRETGDTWIPYSGVVTSESEVINVGDEGELAVKIWLAKMKGWA